MTKNNRIFQLSLLIALAAPLLHSKANAATRVGPAGGSGGSDFSVQCDSGKLRGLLVSTGWYLDSVRMICDNGFGGTVDEGGYFGGNGGSSKRIVCDSGFVMRGIWGYDGKYVDSIGITCVHENDPSISYSTNAYGGSGGSYFDYECGYDQIAHGMFGSAGRLVDSLGLKCTTIRQEPDGCDPWGDDCGAGEMCELEPHEYCGDGWTRGTCVPTPDLCPSYYEPVCGCDLVTYSNRCYAKQAGQNVWEEGSCF